MHPLKHPRNAIFLGLIFVVIGFVYWVIPYVGRPQSTMRASRCSACSGSRWR